jgi:hypothetical protein
LPLLSLGKESYYPFGQEYGYSKWAELGQGYALDGLIDGRMACAGGVTGK